MNWTHWLLPLLLPVLIALPIAGGALAGIISSDRVRNTLVTVLAALIAIGGVAAVYLSTLGSTAVWSYSVEPWMAYVGSGLEIAIIAFILLLALKIKNVWIALFAVLQLIGVIG